MSKNAIPLDRLKWVQLSREDRDIFRTWSSGESREPLKSERAIGNGPVFGRRVTEIAPVSNPPSLRRQRTTESH